MFMFRPGSFNNDPGSAGAPWPLSPGRQTLDSTGPLWRGAVEFGTMMSLQGVGPVCQTRSTFGSNRKRCTPSVTELTQRRYFLCGKNRHTLPPQAALLPQGSWATSPPPRRQWSSWCEHFWTSEKQQGKLEINIELTDLTSFLFFFSFFFAT